jgi:hypothetical protein
VKNYRDLTHDELVLYAGYLLLRSNPGIIKGGQIMDDLCEEILKRLQPAPEPHSASECSKILEQYEVDGEKLIEKIVELIETPLATTAKRRAETIAEVCFMAFMGRPL